MASVVAARLQRLLTPLEARLWREQLAASPAAAAPSAADRVLRLCLGLEAGAGPDMDLDLDLALASVPYAERQEVWRGALRDERWLAAAYLLLPAAPCPPPCALLLPTALRLLAALAAPAPAGPLPIRKALLFAHLVLQLEADAARPPRPDGHQAQAQAQALHARPADAARLHEQEWRWAARRGLGAAEPAALGEARAIVGRSLGHRRSAGCPPAAAEAWHAAWLGAAGTEPAAAWPAARFLVRLLLAALPPVAAPGSPRAAAAAAPPSPATQQARAELPPGDPDVAAHDATVLRELAGALLALVRLAGLRDRQHGDYVRMELAENSAMLVVLKHLSADAFLPFLSLAPSPPAPDARPAPHVERVESTALLVRLLRKVAAGRPVRLKTLLRFKAPLHLRRLVAVTEQLAPAPCVAVLRLECLKLLALALPYLGRRWRQANAAVITQAYLLLPPRLYAPHMAAAEAEDEQAVSPLQDLQERAANTALRLYVLRLAERHPPPPDTARAPAPALAPDRRLQAEAEAWLTEQLQQNTLDALVALALDAHA